MKGTVWQRIAEALYDIDFPADKEAVVAHAESRGGDDEVIGVLKALPPAGYRNISEIRSSVRLDPAEGRSPHQQVAEHRRDT